MNSLVKKNLRLLLKNLKRIKKMRFEVDYKKHWKNMNHTIIIGDSCASR